MEVSLKVWHTNSIRFKDPETQQTLIFLTNSTSLPPLTIVTFYKSRWQVGLFSKWIKQHCCINTDPMQLQILNCCATAGQHSN